MGREEKLAELLRSIREKWEVEFEPLVVDEVSYEVLGIHNMAAWLDQLVASHAIGQPLHDLPLWAKIWPGSLILGRFMRKFEPEGKSLLELGCGMGALSLVASRHGFRSITATDVEEDAIKFTAANALKNNLENLVTAHFLDVTAPPADLPQYDIIAASELLYLDELHRPLLKFLEKGLSSGGRAFFCTDLARLKPKFQKLALKYLPHFKMQEGKIGLKRAGEDGKEERRIFSIIILEKP